MSVLTLSVFFSLRINENCDVISFGIIFYCISTFFKCYSISSFNWVPLAHRSSALPSSSGY